MQALEPCEGRSGHDMLRRVAEQSSSYRNGLSQGLVQTAPPATGPCTGQLAKRERYCADSNVFGLLRATEAKIGQQSCYVTAEKRENATFLNRLIKLSKEYFEPRSGSY